MWQIFLKIFTIKYTFLFIVCQHKIVYKVKSKTPLFSSRDMNKISLFSKLKQVVIYANEKYLRIFVLFLKFYNFKNYSSNTQFTIQIKLGFQILNVMI